MNFDTVPSNFEQAFNIFLNDTTNQILEPINFNNSNPLNTLYQSYDMSMEPIEPEDDSYFQVKRPAVRRNMRLKTNASEESPKNTDRSTEADLDYHSEEEEDDEEAYGSESSLRRVHDDNFRRPFSMREDLLLCKLYKVYGRNWKKMTDYFTKDRTAVKLKNRYYSFTRNEKILAALEFLLNDLEEPTIKIEEYTDDILEGFRTFVPLIKKKKR